MLLKVLRIEVSVYLCDILNSTVLLKILSRVLISQSQSFLSITVLGFPGGASGKEPTSFLPGESLEQRRLPGYSSWGHKELDMTGVI